MQQKHQSTLPHGDQNGSDVMFYFLLLIAIAAMASAQIIIKSQMMVMQAPSLNIWEMVTIGVRNPLLWAGAILLILAAGLWYFCLSRLPLNIAFFFAALAYPMILFGSYVFLNEQIGSMQIIGGALIMLGVVLVALP